MQTGEEVQETNDENQQPPKSNFPKSSYVHYSTCLHYYICNNKLIFSFVIVDLEADISQLEAPTFTTINRGPPEPMLRLRWDHRVNLIGEKVLNPMIHCCDKCMKPILIYGRMVCILLKY